MREDQVIAAAGGLPRVASSIRRIFDACKSVSDAPCPCLGGRQAVVHGAAVVECAPCSLQTPDRRRF